MLILYIGAFRLPNLDAAAPRVINNAKALRALGHDVKFISWGGRYRDEDLCSDGKYRVSEFEYQISGDLPSDHSFKERIICKLFRGHRSYKLMSMMQKPDIIIMYNAGYLFSNRMIKYCSKHNIKLVNDINEWYSNKELHLWDVIVNYVNMTITQHKIKNKIVISSFLNNYYHSSHNILIPPLCDPTDEKWSAIIKDERMIKFHGITLIYAGTPTNKDCINTVIDAVNLLAKEGKTIRFFVLGISQDDYVKQNGRSLASISFNESIIFLGRVSQDMIPAYYKMADFMVLFRESNRKSNAGFPTKVVESLVAGVPVITNSTSDLSKYIINGRTGFLVEDFSLNGILSFFRNNIQSLSKDEIEQMKSFVKNASFVFDWHNKVEDFRHFIQHLQ